MNNVLYSNKELGDVHLSDIGGDSQDAVSQHVRGVDF
jgi:hypothetical protein